tara:strand:- start:941 stop:1324 length:384 start_codon:yes stop_codon:yes gene_type:complete
MAIYCLRGKDSLRFPPELRIRSSSDFVAAKKGKRLDSYSFSLYVHKSKLNRTRLGLIVSKKVGNSVKRNRTKRVLREVFKNVFPGLKSGYDLVIIAKREVVERSFEELIKELDNSLFINKNTKRTKG